MEASNAHGTTPAFTAEALKRLKEVEADWDHRLTETKAQLVARLTKAREAAEHAVHQARTDADKQRESRLSQVRISAEAEADRLIAEGKKAAAAVSTGSIKGAKDKIIEAVLGEFAHGDSGGK